MSGKISKENIDEGKPRIVYGVKMLPESQEIILHFTSEYQRANEYRYSSPNKYSKIIDDLYKEEAARRHNLLANIGNDRDAIEQAKAHLSKRESIVDWMVDWCWTFDPRLVAIGLPANIPFIPFPIHVEFIEWFYDLYLNQEDGLVEKSRDLGATWMFCILFVHEWRWREGFTAGVGSRKLELVDHSDNPKSIFHKIRHIINTQPHWWLPDKWHNKYSMRANITNPDNGSNIAGEGGDDIGRGDRRSVYFVDESASLEHPGAVDAALSETTNSQFDLSTPKGLNHFGKKRKSGRVKVFTLSWKDDPRKDKQWKQKKDETKDRVVVAQEIEIDYQASVDNLFIPPQHVAAAVDFDIHVTGVCAAGLDVAAGGRNKSSLAIRNGNRVTVKRYNFKNGIDLTHFAVEKCNEAGVSYLNFDPIGVGHGVYSAIERTEMPMSFDYYPVGANESPSDEFYEEFGRYAKEVFYNAVSEWWYRASVFFKNTYEFIEHGIPHKPDEMISIENNGDLISQLSSPMKKFKTSGKIYRESKEEMKSREIESPDEADSLIMSLIPQKVAFNRVWPSYNKSNYQPTKIDFKNLEPGMSQILIVLVLDKAGGIYGNCFFWGRKSRVLRVYSEISHPSPVAAILGNDIRIKAVAPLNSNSTGMTGVSKIYCNPEMDHGKQDWAYTLRKKARIRVHVSHNYDENASNLIARNMFARKQVIVDRSCKDTNMQYKNWRIVKGKPEVGYPHCKALCIAVSELKHLRELEETGTFLKPYSRKKEQVRKKLEKTDYSTGVRTLNTTTHSEYDYLTK